MQGTTLNSTLVLNGNSPSIFTSFRDTVSLTSQIKSKVTENELIHLLQLQDEKAVSYFVSTYQDSVFRVCHSFLLNALDAEDAAQETFMDAIVHIHEFHADSSLKTWLFRIATNRSLQVIRSKNRKKRFAHVFSLFGTSDNDEPIQIEDEHQNIEKKLENDRLSEDLKRSVQKLPEQQRIAFTLVYLNEHSYQETAEIMETSLKAVESLLSRSKKNLRKTLEGKGYGNN
ncbi:RNA polymerase sigma factor [bacterium]|nr:MAG: RNA polymerase sigma factor [bacterium]